MIRHVYTKIKHLSLMLFLASTASVHASDFIAITAPANSSTVSGMPLLMAGTSSQAGFTVKLTVNTTVIGFVTTDGSGNWSSSLDDLGDGNYTLTADLLDGGNNIIATTTNSFAVFNQAISFSNLNDQDVICNPVTASGTSTAAFATVNLSVDGTLVSTTSTDVSGNWSARVNFSTCGVHIILAELVVSGSTVASNTVGVSVSLSPIFVAWANSGALTANSNNFMKFGTTATSATEVQQVRVHKDCTAKDFWMSVGTVGDTITGTVRKNGIDTGLALTMSGSSAINSSDTVDFSAGDLISIKVVTGNTAPSDLIAEVTLQ